MQLRRQSTRMPLRRAAVRRALERSAGALRVLLASFCCYEPPSCETVLVLRCASCGRRFVSYASAGRRYEVQPFRDGCETRSCLRRLLK